ncbi:OmpA family protein [Rhodovibrio salinarum]|nr:OmpA family protein [Rhodovibrio salinarum]
MLLAYVPRSIDARWLSLGALVLCMALSPATPAGAQDGTVYIGGGSNSDTGARGVQGRDNVIVNLDAIGVGRDRTSNDRAPSPTGNAARATPAPSSNQPAVTFGEPFRGPTGTILRYPPQRPPRSELVIDPETLSERRVARETTQPRDPTPARKPAQRRSATPGTKPQMPTRSENATGDAESTTAPETVRPTRKPQAPQPTQQARQAPEDASETASPSRDQSSDGITSVDAGSQATPAPEREAVDNEPATVAESDGDAPAETTEDQGTDAPQTAALPPNDLPDQTRLIFDGESAALSDSAKQSLDQLAAMLADNPQQRIQLKAFAEGTEDTASQARRLSLSRALAVRTYLIDQGIRSTRMDVRALGATAQQGPLGRVDIVPANR